MNVLFSFLLLIAITLLPWTQSALAENQSPIEPVRTIAYISYPSLDTAQANEKLFKLETKGDYYYASTGPSLSSQELRYTWICPEGASLVNNACYTKSESGVGFILVNPSAAQVAFGYNVDTNSTTNEQLIFLAKATEIIPANAAESDPFFSGEAYQEYLQHKKGCKSSRECSVSWCANGMRLYPPNPCPQ